MHIVHCKVDPPKSHKKMYAHGDLYVVIDHGKILKFIKYVQLLSLTEI